MTNRSTNAWLSRNRGTLALAIDCGPNPAPLVVNNLLKSAENLRLPAVWGLPATNDRHLVAQVLTASTPQEIAVRIDPRGARLADLEARMDDFAATGLAPRTLIAAGRRLPAEWRRALRHGPVRVVATEHRRRRKAFMRSVETGLWESAADLSFSSSHVFPAPSRQFRRLRAIAEQSPGRLHVRIALHQLAKRPAEYDRLLQFLKEAADYRDRGMLRVATLSEAIAETVGTAPRANRVA